MEWRRYPVPAKKASGIIISHPLMVILQNKIHLVFEIGNGIEENEGKERAEEVTIQTRHQWRWWHSPTGQS